MTKLGAGTQHRRSLREQVARQQGALHPLAQRGHFGVATGALGAAVEAQVVAVAVAVAFAIGFVVALVEAQQVAQGEAVVGNHEVHRLGRCALAWLKQVEGAAQPQREVAARARPVVRARHAAPAEPEPALRVAELVIPLEPSAREVAQLVAACPEVPGFGDHLQGRQHRVLRQGGEERAVAVETLVAAPEHRRQVEAKAVDMHIRGPVAQAVHHQPQQLWATDIQRVAATCQVFVLAWILCLQTVIAGIVESAKAQRRSGRVRFRCVVEDNVEQHLDSGRVQHAHHGAKFVARGLTLSGAR